MTESMSRQNIHPATPMVRQIRSQRFLLRPPLRTDDDYLEQLYQDSDNMAFIRPLPWRKGELAASIDRFHQHWSEHGYGMWMIANQANGSLVGYCGLRHHPDLPNLEIGYLIDRPHWGKGIAIEAASAVINYAEDVLKVRQLVAVTALGHAASQRVLEKLGFSRQADIIYNQEKSGSFRLNLSTQ